MKTRKIAAAVALSLVGVVPAGLALADPNGGSNPPEHCGDGHGNDGTSNKHCTEQAPGNSAEHRQDGQASAQAPTYKLDTYNLSGGGHSGSELPVRVQAIQQEQDGDDYAQGGTVLGVTGPEGVSVTVTDSSVSIHTPAVDKTFTKP